MKFHILRLEEDNPDADIKALMDDLKQRIDSIIKVNNFNRADFEFADKVTQFCDDIFFDFCLGESNTGSVAVQPKHHSSNIIEISYEITNESSIIIDPWLFKVDEYESVIFGYKRELYPDRLKPVSFQFKMSRKC